MRSWKTLEAACLMPVLAGAFLACGGSSRSLPAPTGLKATAGNDAVTLSWEAAPGATGYHVKVATVGGAFADAGWPSATTCTCGGLTNGTTYRFVVSAVDSQSESAGSPEVTCVPLLSAPAKPTAMAVDGGVVLTWAALDGATRYHVNRAEGSGAFSQIADLVGNTFTDSGLTNGTAYRYTVSALDAGGESAPSQEASCQPVAGAWFDPLNALNGDRYLPTDSIADGGSFDCYWSPSHITFADGVMTFTFDDTPKNGEDYTAAELSTKGRYLFGTFETSMKAAKGDGIMSSFFVNGWDEIDFEFMGNDTTTVYVHYYLQGNDGLVWAFAPLGFDASEGFHRYTIEWDPNYITWYADGVPLLTTKGTDAPIPYLHPMHIIQNLWTCKELEYWLGQLNYTAPIRASYDYFHYVPK